MDVIKVPDVNVLDAVLLAVHFNALEVATAARIESISNLCSLQANLSRTLC